MQPRDICANHAEAAARYGVRFQRLYKDGDDWKTTDSLGSDELALVATVADLAHTWVYLEGKSGNGNANGSGAGN